MSSVSSNRSFVHDEAGYEEVYPSGHNDHESQSEEKSPSASSTNTPIPYIQPIFPPTQKQIGVLV